MCLFILCLSSIHPEFQPRLLDSLPRWVVCREHCSTGTSSTGTRRLSNLKRVACFLKMIFPLMMIVVWKTCFQAWIYNSESPHQYRTGQISSEQGKSDSSMCHALCNQCCALQSCGNSKRDKTGQNGTKHASFSIHCILNIKGKTGQNGTKRDSLDPCVAFANAGSQ